MDLDPTLCFGCHRPNDEARDLMENPPKKPPTRVEFDAAMACFLCGMDNAEAREILTGKKTTKTSSKKGVK